MRGPFLIVGLGNPGIMYRKTRHNVGFRVVSKLAEGEGVKFKKNRMKGYIAKAFFDDERLYILKPTTYMNRSGSAVRAFFDFYGIASQDLLVVADDVNIPFGEMRIKERGSSGGHNGLKSVEESFGMEYSRLRIGVGRGKGDLERYVLKRFSKEEERSLGSILEKAVSVVYIWLKNGMADAMNVANVKTAKGIGYGE